MHTNHEISYFALTHPHLSRQLHRLLQGISVRAKSLRFSISVAVYFSALAVFVKHMPQYYFTIRRVQLLIVIPVTSTLFEIVHIAV